MAWTTARTWTTGEVVTASYMNAQIRDNSNFLVGSAALVATSQTTSSASYTDLGTVGPAVTITTGTTVAVWLTSGFQHDTATALASMSVAVSGATTVAAADTAAAICDFANTGSVRFRFGPMTFLSGLTAGSNTFTAKYKTNAGNATFVNRNILVMNVNMS